MTTNFYDHPILNSPYEYPNLHWELEDGIPTNRIVEGRRQSEYITPVPLARRQSVQRAMVLGVPELSSAEQEYDPTPVINEIRRRVNAWRSIPNPQQWGVTPETARLLQHWRHYEFQGVRPFFCQIEAAETIIWLTEVAGVLRNNPVRQEFRGIHRHISEANARSNPELLRLAMKMATGAGKTTVMAMLIAWQTVNAVRYPQRQNFTKGFLIVTPGIVIRDRLRVLYPNDTENYYEHRNLVPQDMLGDISKARVVITNFHAFRLRETESIAANTRSLLRGRNGLLLNTLESEGQMLRRVMPLLMGLKNVLVFNDEGHHCYREKPPEESDEREIEEEEEKREATKNNEAARVWITGIETIKRKVGVHCVLDFSATPFFLRGSGYAEGTLFPWTVSDFSLVDAIESGIVKIPRVPVADNAPGENSPIYRNLWTHIRDRLPRLGRRQAGDLDPLSLPPELVSAMETLYGHYEGTFQLWSEAGIKLPPVFIVVCNNTATSKLIYDFMSGFERKDTDGNLRTEFLGRFDLFSNYDRTGKRLAMPRTLLVDSEQLESDDALSSEFRAVAAAEIEHFRGVLRERPWETPTTEKVSDRDLLREVMNTVGKEGQLGESIRCVVSVSMLSEGWDANTVTHILGVRAFGTQLLCEQVVGRALRRESYDLNKEGLFDVEYAEVLGIPFDFTAAPVVVSPKPPRPTVRVHSISPERDHLEISFPRVTGYRVELPDERISADFNEDSVLELTPKLVGPSITSNLGIIGEGVELNIEHLNKIRRQKIVYELSKYILETHMRTPGESPRMHLFAQLRGIVGEWLDNYLRCYGGTLPAQLLYREIAARAGERINVAITNAAQRSHPGDTKLIKAVIDPYTPTGSTRFVNFTTSKSIRWQTDPRKCHINLAICDGGWEAELCRVIERQPRVFSYAKNQGMGFEVPYKLASLARTYVPDFIIQMDDGRGSNDLLNLVIEVKGYRGEDAITKANTMHSYWIPGVNNLGCYGRWAFHELTSVYEIQDEFDILVKRLSEFRDESYAGLGFKELLAACPIDGIDLSRSDELPREIEFDVSD